MLSAKQTLLHIWPEGDRPLELVTRYQRAFASIRATALDPERSARLIRSLARGLGR